MDAVPSGELSSIISMSNCTGSAEIALIMASIFSFFFYVGIITMLDMGNKYLRKYHFSADLRLFRRIISKIK